MSPLSEPITNIVKAIAREMVEDEFKAELAARRMLDQRLGENSMTAEVLHYHRKILERVSEDNPNNARVPAQVGKGHRECLERGWIEERTHPHGGYRYYAMTPAGEEELRQPKPAKAKPPRRLKTLPPRIPGMPPGLRSS